jgi:glycosyltransferase involved in cell wall biosynthesis
MRYNLSQVRKKLAIVYPYFAHYREPVFNEIDKKLDLFDVEYIADTKANIPSLKTINFEEKQHFSKVKNIWFGKFLWQHGLFSLLFSSRPDAIIFLGQFNLITTWVNAIIFKSMGTKILFWGHGCYGNESAIKKNVRRLFNRIPNTHLLYGNYAKKLLIELGFNQDKLKVIFNSLDYEKQNTVLSSLTDEVKLDVRKSIFNDNPDRPLLLFIGRLTPIKQLDVLIECLEILNKKGRFCNCIFIGSGPEEERLKQMASISGISSSVKFFGECHDESILGELIYSADVCVSPGNVGLTAMHSLAYGTPVVTHDNFKYQMPEFEAITNNVTGSFYTYGSIDSLVACITTWFDLSKNEKEHRSKACMNVISQYYNPEKQAELISMALDELFLKKV